MKAKGIKDLKGWGIYTDNYCKQVGKVWVHISKFNDESGISYWRWFTSVNRWPEDCGLLWRDKNRAGRKLDTKYFLSRDECLQHALLSAR